MYFPQNTLMLTESRGKFSDLHSIFFVRFAIRENVVYEATHANIYLFILYFQGSRVKFGNRYCCHFLYFPRYLNCVFV